MKSRLWFAPPEVIPRLKTSRAGASSSGALPPIEPPAGAYVWLDASALAGANGAPVPLWPDSGSSGFPATDGGGLLTPPTLALDFDGNGNQGVSFNGAQGLAWAGGTLNFTGAVGVTLCGVLISSSASGGAILSSFQTRDWELFYDSSDLGLFTTTSTFSSPVFPNAELYAFEMQQPRDGSDVPRFWKNGNTSAGAGSSFLGSVEDSPVGTTLGVYIGGGFFWSGVMGDFLIYKRQFDAADRAQWAAYIADKYGL